MPVANAVVASTFRKILSGFRVAHDSSLDNRGFQNFVGNSQLELPVAAFVPCMRCVSMFGTLHLPFMSPSSTSSFGQHERDSVAPGITQQEVPRREP